MSRIAAPPIPSRDRVAAARVLVVGDAMLDRYWFGAVDRISPEAPVPVVRVHPGKQQERLGGAANVAWNVKSLGAHASLLTAIGDDEQGHRLEKLIEASGIESLFKRDARLTTTVKLRVIGRSQQLLRVDFEEEPDHEVLEDMRAPYDSALASADAVLFSDYGKGGLTHIPAMIRAARSAGRAVLVDPKGSDYGRYRGASVITPNRNELAQVIGAWTSEAQLRERAQALRAALELDALLLTRSEDGMSLFDATGQVDIPAEAREVFDVTGAGDTVIATLAAMLAAGLALRDAMPIANRAGSIVVGKFGTASVTYDELVAAGGGS
ncbi:MAG TPA: D-glycero-beta-D-manno-heptose-7-phosphate kinase [Caldimonas sp.]|nr:D-glycero-beta-D-manno-heptose-7-phosphate kinase [Caldimonas sp.]HEX4235374.1 D-glycero-beta-D-manno-heptose-7-phosphate kinase [Caldimonas sp.]